MYMKVVNLQIKINLYWLKYMLNLCLRLVIFTYISFSYKLVLFLLQINYFSQQMISIIFFQSII